MAETLFLIASGVYVILYRKQERPMLCNDAPGFVAVNLSND